MSLTIRLVTLLVILVGIHVAYAYIKSGSLITVRPPKTDISDLPLNLGNWKCTGPSQRRLTINDLAGADFSIDRVYRNDAEQAQISVYVGCWNRYVGFFHFPHRPEGCYKGEGFEIVEKTEVHVPQVDGSDAKSCLMHVERSDRKAFVLFWYQLGSETMYSEPQMGKIRSGYLGSGYVPPLVKVLLHTRGMNQEQAKRRLVDIGQQILKWTATEL